MKKKRILFALLLRLILILVLLSSIAIFNAFSVKIYLSYVIVSIFLFGYIFIRVSSTFNISSKSKKTKIIFTKIGLSVADFSLFLLLGRIFNYYIAIICSQIFLHPVKSWIYHRYYFKTGNTIDRFLLFPLPIMKEVKWLFIRAFGRFMQKYWPASQLTQKTLVSTTHFFRDTIEYEDKLVKYASKINVETIHILVIGCATGQEAYSIAIVCQEHGIDSKIEAIDLSEEAINKALVGEYNYGEEIARMQRAGKYDSIKQLDYYRKYFNLSEETISVSDRIKSSVNFEVQDIAKIDPDKKYDFVFARKMLYYLPKTVLPSIEQKMKQALKINASKENLIIDDYSKRVLKEYFK